MSEPFKLRIEVNGVSLAFDETEEDAPFEIHNKEFMALDKTDERKPDTVALSTNQFLMLGKLHATVKESLEELGKLQREES